MAFHFQDTEKVHVQLSSTIDFPIKHLTFQAYLSDAQRNTQVMF